MCSNIIIRNKKISAKAPEHHLRYMQLETKKDKRL
jgi:hypothetical protein